MTESKANERLLDRILLSVFSQRRRLLKQSGVLIYTYYFRLFGRKWFIMTSSDKWRKGDKYRKAPIWADKIGGELPTLFIGKLAIGYEPKTKEANA